MPGQPSPTLTAGAIGTGDKESSLGIPGIQFQHQSLDWKAHPGVSFTIGRRSVPSANAGFSMSGAQFGSGHAKSLYGGGNETQEEEEEE